MRLTKTIILFFLIISCFTRAISQSKSGQNDIDRICIRIDSLLNSFEEFDFNINYPHVFVGTRIHYIDTLNKQYKKIIIANELDSLTKIFYFEKDNLIEIKLKKNASPNQNAIYQFKDYVVADSWDEYKLVKNSSGLISEAKRYFSLVRYKHR